MSNDMLSVVIPCYNEEETLLIFMDRIIPLLTSIERIDYELLFIDDGSQDKTLHLIKEASNTDERIRYVSFSRNFGKEAAMLAGLSSAKGDYVAIMDADLQDPPELLPEMLETVLHEGYDCAATRRTTRKGEPRVRSFLSRVFYKLINRISHADIIEGARDYRLMTRQMVDAVLSLQEYNRFSKGIFGWVGFNTKWIAYDNLPRIAGTTKWSFWKLLIYALDGIIGFSTAPLAVASYTGVLFFVISILGTAFIFIRKLLIGDPVAGWASTVCIVLFASGVQLFCVGILGQYMAKNYLESKHRPIYIIRETSDTK